MILLLAALADAPGELLEAKLFASVHARESRAVVEISYRLLLPEGAVHVPFTLLQVSGTELESIEAESRGSKLSVAIDFSRKPQLRGVVELPPAPERETPFPLDLRYGVRAPGLRPQTSFRLAVPVPVVAYPPREARGGAFTATVELPPGMRLVESFPSAAVRTGDGLHALELAIPPAFLVLHGAADQPILTFPRVIDAGVLLLLAGLGVLGLRVARGRFS